VKFKATVTATYDFDVEADSLDEAYEKATDEWTNLPSSDVEIGVREVEK